MTDAAALFNEIRPHIERVARAICHRHGTADPDADDFVQSALLHFRISNHAVLRRYGGKGRPEAFIGSVVANLFGDARRRERGRYRPSAAATRLGPIAIRLERLLYNGYSHREAVATLASRDDVSESERELEQLLGRLSARRSRLWLGEGALRILASPCDAEAAMMDRERDAAARSVLQSLEAEDALILRMRYVDGYTVQRIAEILHLDPRRLYIRFADLKKRLKARLQDLGVDES